MYNLRRGFAPGNHPEKEQRRTDADESAEDRDMFYPVSDTSLRDSLMTERRALFQPHPLRALKLLGNTVYNAVQYPQAKVRHADFVHVRKGERNPYIPAFVNRIPLGCLYICWAAEMTKGSSRKIPPLQRL
jgi:hypothetical protein